MATFNLPMSDPRCEVHLPPGLVKEQLLSFPAFKTWSNTILHSLFLQYKPEHEFRKDPYKLRSITVQSVDWVGSEDKKRPGSITMQVEITNDSGESLPGAVFLRGGSVAMLLVLQPDDVPVGCELDEHAVMTIQPRVAAGSVGFAEIPVGMLDNSGTFSGSAAKEIGEATGLKINAEDVLDMTAFALAIGDKSSEQLQKGVYMSPGVPDEFVPIFLHLRRIPRWELKTFEGRLTGRRDQGEKITLKLVRLEDLWTEGARDAKALAALALYRGLKDASKS